MTNIIQIQSEHLGCFRHLDYAHESRQFANPFRSNNNTQKSEFSIE